MILRLHNHRILLFLFTACIIVLYTVFVRGDFSRKIQMSGLLSSLSGQKILALPPHSYLTTKLNSGEVWRDPIRYRQDTIRAPQPIPGSVIRPLSDDPLDPRADDIFLMAKTGSDVMWSRMPVHLHTTFSRFPNFAIYSDRPGTIAGYEVIDVFADMPEDVLNSQDLFKYRIMREMQDDAWMWSAEDITLEEGWNMDRFKNIPMMLHAYKTAPAKTQWFIMIDDDTYMFSGNIAKFLRTLDSSRPYYIGSIAMVRDVFFAHGGSGVIFSRAALDKVFGPEARLSHEELLNKYANKALDLNPPFGDLMAAHLLEFDGGVYLNTKDPDSVIAKLDLFDRSQDMFQGERIASTWVNEDLWCCPLGTFHKLRPNEIETLWEWEQSRASPGYRLLYYDFYHDFILPYISEEVENWVIPGGKILDDAYIKEFQGAFDDWDSMPSEDKESCKKACINMDKCLSWSFKPGECRVQENRVSRGIHASLDDPTWVSGFLIDKIRKIRIAQTCDPLTLSELGIVNDSPKTSEGWYHRKRA